MNTLAKDRRKDLKIDNAANAVLIAAGLLVVLNALATMDTGPKAGLAQAANQMPAERMAAAPAPVVAQPQRIGRIVVAAQRPKAERNAPDGRGESMLVARPSPRRSVIAVASNPGRIDRVE